MALSLARKQKTVADVRSTFDSMIQDLAEIQTRESYRAEELRVQAEEAQEEANAADRFRVGLVNLVGD